MSLIGQRESVSFTQGAASAQHFDKNISLLFKWHTNMAEEEAIFNLLTKTREEQLELVFDYSWFHIHFALYRWTVLQPGIHLFCKTKYGSLSDTCAVHADKMSKQLQVLRMSSYRAWAECQVMNLQVRHRNVLCRSIYTQRCWFWLWYKQQVHSSKITTLTVIIRKWMSSLKAQSKDGKLTLSFKYLITNHQFYLLR